MIDPPLDEAEFERWREDAGRALAASRALAGNGHHNWACFTAEQAAQLALKGLLHGIGRGERGHGLPRLARAIGAQGVSIPDEVTAGLRRLAREYIPARYPDAHPEGGAGEHFGASDSEQALADAEAILDVVDRAWQELHDA